MGSKLRTEFTSKPWEMLYLMEGGDHRLIRVGPKVLGYYTAGAEFQLQTVGLQVSNLQSTIFCRIPEQSSSYRPWDYKSAIFNRQSSAEFRSRVPATDRGLIAKNRRIHAAGAEAPAVPIMVLLRCAPHPSIAYTWQ